MDMLTFSKDREPEPVPGDLNEVVGDVVELMQARADELEVELDWQPAPDMPTCLFDPEGIHRAVLNIVTNAIDACEKQPGGRVSREHGLQPGRIAAAVVVDDNGSGIPDEELGQDLRDLRLAQGGRGTGPGPAGQPEDPQRARRPHPRRKPARGRAAASRSNCRPSRPTRPARNRKSSPERFIKGLFENRRGLSFLPGGSRIDCKELQNSKR